MKPTIVLDFDGTLALGTGPIAAYAREIAVRSGDEGFLDRAMEAIAAFEAGQVDYLDGYDAVAKVAVADEISLSIRSAAYASSRALLGTVDAPVEPPAGLTDFLHGISNRARFILATNAPGDRILTVLEDWGVRDLFDELHFTVGKPQGLVPVLKAALELGPVLSIGDIVEFDLAPAISLGADAALVGPTTAASLASTAMSGRTLAELYPQITAWVDGSAENHPTSFPDPSKTNRSIERKP